MDRGTDRNAGRRGGMIMLVVDVLVVAVFIYCIPYFRRPLDILAGLMVALGVATAVFSRRGWLQNLSLCAVGVGAALFLIEMSPKFVNMEQALDEEDVAQYVGGGEQRWDLYKPRQYVSVVEKLVADGDPRAPELAVLAPGEEPESPLLAGMDPAGIRSRTTHPRGRSLTLRSLKPFYEEREPFGRVMCPDNLLHEYTVENETRTLLYNASYTVNRHNFRETKGDPESGETYVFMGCSFTFGSGVDDDETPAHYFSQAAGFTKQVLNIAVNGYGVHQCLRDLELNYTLGKAGVDPGEIKGIVYQYLGAEHNRRAVDPSWKLSPRYALENGRAVFKGTFHNADRAFLLLERSRVYPILRERLFSRSNSRFREDNWALGLAIVAEMHRICRERYGIPLTVVLWDENAEAAQTMRDQGVDVIPLSEILGADWNENAAVFQQFDTHPTAYANRLIGEFLYRRIVRGDN